MMQASSLHPAPPTPILPGSPIVYDVVHTTAYSYSEPVPVCHNEVHLQPRTTASQRVRSHNLSVKPLPVRMSNSLDYFSNHVGIFSLEEVHEKLVVSAASRVEIWPSAPWEDLVSRPWELVRDHLAHDSGPESLSAGQFRFDSPMVRSNPKLAEWAGLSFRPGRPWAEAVVDLTHRIHSSFAYDPAATTTSTPVEEVFDLKRGVCQDFAHLQIACLRSLGLAARYVSGYLCNLGPPPTGEIGSAVEQGMVGADASHAWLSCWGGEAGWLDVDPTNRCVVGGLHVTVAWGRDYGDVCPIKGVYVGGGHHSMEVAVRVTRAVGDEARSTDQPLART